MSNAASSEAIEEVYEMISEAENQVCKTSKERMQRLIELKAMEVRDVKATDKSNRGLLRRYYRENEDGHNKQLLTQLENMTELLKEDSTVESKVCFVTQQTSFQETKDVLEDRAEMFKRHDIPWERVFGWTGRHPS